MPILPGLMGNQRLQTWAWYLFDAGNSAHALLVSTVGFALYFRQYLFSTNPDADSLWGFITALILAISALVSPILTSWLCHHRTRWLGIGATTIGCVFFTVLLGFDFSTNPSIVVLVYVLSAIGYYAALPIYTSYINEVGNQIALDRKSGNGWAIGYVGGIVVALIALGMGSLTAPIAEQPNRFREIFVLAGVFNLAISAPLLYWAWLHDSREAATAEHGWNLNQVSRILMRCPQLIRLLFSYWMVSEAGTIAIYFTAIFLGQYAGLPIAGIFALTLFVQLVAAASTWYVGRIATTIGPKRPFVIVCWLWVAVPPLLWAVKYGLTYWIPIFFMGLVLGAHHALVRAEVVRVAHLSDFAESERGSIFGFLEVSGRVSSIFGPLVVGLLSLLMELSEALLVASIFPAIALLIIRRYKWVGGF